MSELGPVGAAYAGVRARMTDLLAGVAPGAFRSLVPACPDWTVHDLMAHVGGVMDDILTGNIEGAGTDAWTAAQVDARRDVATGDLVSAWNERAAQVEALLDAIGPPGRQVVFDAVTHEHDLRGALRAAGARDSDGIAIGLSFLGPAIAGAAAAAGVPTFVVATSDGQSWMAGPDGTEVVAALTAAPFDLLRAATGRRSTAQIRAMAWEGNVDAVLPAFAFGPFAPRPDDLVE